MLFNLPFRKTITMAAAVLSVQTAMATAASNPALAEAVKTCESDARVLADHFFKSPGGRPAGDTVDARVVVDAAFERLYSCVDRATKLHTVPGSAG